MKKNWTNLVFGLMAFSFIVGSVFFTNTDLASANSVEDASPVYEEVHEGVFVNTEILDSMSEEELSCLLNLSPKPQGISLFALPQEDNCYFWYKQDFSTAGYNAASSAFAGAAFGTISYKVHPALGIPLGAIVGYYDAYKSDSVLYGSIEYYNCYYASGNFKKVMKLTKYYYDSKRTLQHSVWVG